MTEKLVIVVFGLPGAGKTTLINNFIQQHKNFIRLSGGSLINEELSEAERDTLRKQEKSQVLNNQEKLVVNFARRRRELLDMSILFDGHCVVKDGDNIVMIPTEIIGGLNPDLIVFIDEDAETIISRRRIDTQRPSREDETAQAIQANRDMQVKICQEYSRMLNVPFVLLRNATVSALSDQILEKFPDIKL